MNQLTNYTFNGFRTFVDLSEGLEDACTALAWMASSQAMCGRSYKTGGYSEGERP